LSSVDKVKLYPFIYLKGRSGKRKVTMMREIAEAGPVYYNWPLTRN
jgi:hypothetical protein